MKKINFNANWEYFENKKEAVVRKIHLPHDAMIYQDRIPRLKNGSFTGFFPSSDYTYIKKFHGDTNFLDKKVILEFEGVYMDSTIYLNGKKIGGHVYGYSNFYVDLTDKIRIDEENVLKVSVHCSQVPNTRWYPGNGIYRPVNLFVGNKECIEIDGIAIDTISIYPTLIHFRVETPLAENYDIQTDIYYGDKKILDFAGKDNKIIIPNAKLWNEENPNLYTAQIKLLRDGVILDETSQTFGIRTLEWSAEKGLQVNGESINLRGGCVHHDNGILGACGFEAAEYRKVRILKKAGFNAIRSSHYPISKFMLNACDELGMYVMDESFDTWRDSNGLYGYTLHFDEEWEDDLRKMILKDRNHPSVIMYSIGNEISDTAWPRGAELAEEMTNLCHSIDPSRPVTVCPNLFMNLMSHKGLKLKLGDGNEPKKEDITDPLSQDPDSKVGGSALINILMATGPYLMKLFMKPKGTEKYSGHTFSKVDIAGYNYAEQVYEGHHKMVPDRIIVGSETHPNKIAKNWKLVKNNAYIIGDFMWTAMDYLGEVGVGIVEYGKSSGAYIKPYPTISAYTGVIDLIGHRELNSFIAERVWDLNEKPYIAVQPVNHYKDKKILSHYRYSDAIGSWTWPGYEGEKAIIEVYSKGYKVELIQDGKSLGTKKIQNFMTKFKSIYNPGILEAISYDDKNNIIAKSKLSSANHDTSLKVTIENDVIVANGEDLSFINVEITDSNGIIKMLSDRVVSIDVKGEGTLQAVGSANPRADESYTGSYFTTYRGRMQAIVRSSLSGGEIQVTVEAEGLDSKHIIIKTQ